MKFLIDTNIFILFEIVTEANTAKLEQKIDRLVYELYELSEEEIKVVEGINND